MDHTDLSTHFRFGENWRSFAEGLDDAKIAEAVRNLAKLVPADVMAGKRFLDVGCGSGLSMLAALRLGAAHSHGIDLDPASVEAARTVLSRHAPKGSWSVEVRSVFDLDAEASGQFDVVHSWGVLHHTGAMWKALENCARLVPSGGLFVFALYHLTPFCQFWRAEKRLYAHAPRIVQASIRGLYKALYLGRIMAGGQNPRRHLAQYHESRGMDWHHNVHDWLGGYPYESTLPDEVRQRVAAYGLHLEKVFENCAGTIGVFGTGCDEYIARRR
jgi:2-polyprenyl-6-hydroxyphenyl methylase/3-demethylubiquinone-9 3-methyltransferase